MTIKVAINGFGRMGRLTLRAAWNWGSLEIVHINEIAGNIETAAHLLQYDSIHSKWENSVNVEENQLVINGKHISYSSNRDIESTNWKTLGADIVIDCTGQFKSKETLQPYFDAGVRKVIVSAPIKDGTLNVVMGVNHHLYNSISHNIITAASCTTNCIAPVIDVIHKQFGIRHGCINTIHNITNTQSILDEYHGDLRRSRACGQSLIPTTTGSATAIAEIFPELRGKLNGVAVRVPLANASLTDCVFELNKKTSAQEINQALREASLGYLNNILGCEDKPLVSVDYTNDTRSAIIDTLSTMVINHTQVKLLVWYDNEVGYVNRMVELTDLVAQSLS